MFPITSSTPTQQVMLAPKHLKRTEKHQRPWHRSGVSCRPRRALPPYRIKIRAGMETSNVTPPAIMHAHKKIELQNLNTAHKYNII